METRLSALGAIVVAIASLWLSAAAADTARPRILVLGPDEEPRFSQVARGLREGLGDQGRAATTFTLHEVRVPRGERAAARAAVEQAVRTPTQAAFVIGSVLARVMREAAPDVPVVFITPGDPVAGGVAESFRRPGGNATAIMFEYPELSAKRLELLKELAPRTRRVLAVHDPRDPSPLQGLAAAQAAASRLGVTVVSGEVRRADALTAAWDAAGQVDGVLLIPGGVTTAMTREAIALALARRVPLVSADARDASAGALATYGASDVDVAREAARLVDKVLRGARAGELPVERPTKLRLRVNRKTARALGLTVPDTVLVRADEALD